MALREEGELALWKLAIKTGQTADLRAVSWGAGDWSAGQSGSTLVTFGLLARPYLLRRLGVQRVEPLGFPMPAGFTWNKPGKRREYLRARLENGRVVPYPNQSSGVLRSAAWAEGLPKSWKTRRWPRAIACALSR